MRSSGSDTNRLRAKHQERRNEVVEREDHAELRGERNAIPPRQRTFVIAGYIIANSPIGTPS